MTEQPDKWRVVYYQDDDLNVPVSDWLDELSDTAVARILHTIDLLRDHGVNLGTYYSHHVRGKIFGLRIQSGTETLRILYVAVVGHKFVLLHGFSKHTQKIPEREIVIAEKRLADYQRRTKGAQ